jgi:hypothetical protein
MIATACDETPPLTRRYNQCDGDDPCGAMQYWRQSTAA